MANFSFSLPFFKKNSLLSIDIGFRNIKVTEVEIERDGKIFIDNFGIAATPKGCIKNGAIKDVSKITEEIRKVIEEHHMKAKKAKIVMSGTNIISRVLMLDNVPDLRDEHAFKSLIYQYIPINTGEYQINWKVLQTIKEGSVEKAKIFVTAAHKSIIKSYVDVLSGLRLTPVSIDIPANSTAKFFNRDIQVNESLTWFKQQKLSKAVDDTFAVLDFGSETTIINILRDKVLEFNKVVLIGSSNLDTVLANSLGMSESEAERIKRMYGMDKSKADISSEHEAIYLTVKSKVDEIVKQIIQCFEFYEKRCFGSKVGKIYIIGGGSMLKGLREYLEESLHIPVFPVGLLSIDGIELNPKLDADKINFFINSVGITL
ncbi:MAG TPA: pilus assembly protein PilM [Clostridia bacterium]|nr:pilus assembly protein PilM [Clostridia bacterium]